MSEKITSTHSLKLAASKAKPQPEAALKFLMSIYQALDPVGMYPGSPDPTTPNFELEEVKEELKLFVANLIREHLPKEGTDEPTISR